MKSIVLSLAGLLVLAGCKSAPPAGDSLIVPVEKSAWQTPFGHGTVSATEHYQIFSTVSRPALMAAFPGFMEAAYARYAAMTGLKNDAQEPAQIYVLATRKQWDHFTRQMVKDNLQTYLSIDAGGYCYHGTCVFWDVGGVQTLRLAAHEGLHQFLGSRVGHLPIWLEEGLCVCAEGLDLESERVVFEPRRNRSRLACLRNALVARHWIKLEQLVSMDGGDAVRSTQPNYALEYYSQLWALVQYLQSKPETRQAVESIIADAASRNLQPPLNAQLLKEMARQGAGANPGKVFARLVFQKYIVQDLEGFERGYIEFARKLAEL